ncbi:MAG: chitobiase/beta-hexosaminidase C-terminal domain-containing protein [Eubacteriales bacterium]|nr:chitobiase/beta-hexosaminidase C-terminal domain-containing protein [Eubacteriales bacterium]
MLDNNKNVNNDDTLDEDFLKSLEKMVEEETNVAKAFVDNQRDEKDSKDDSLDKTRVIPSIPEEYEQEDILMEEDDEPVVAPARQPGNKYKSKIEEKKKEEKKKKIIIASICGVAALILIIVIIVVTVVSNNNKKSYKYNYDKGMSYYNEKDYSDALTYLKKAADEADGKKNLDLKYALYECYYNTGDTASATDMLKDILSYDKDNEKALKALAKIYSDNKNGDKLTELLRSYKDSPSLKYLSDYKVSDPVANVASGNYDDTVKLQFASGNDDDFIYYTTDKSEPTNKSTIYTGEPIEIINGTTTVKVVAMNKDNVYSNVVEYTYVVDYKKPGLPSVSPASGNYSEGQKITIDNIPEGSKAYYTLDGTTPTKNSTEYTGEFDMPVGNTVVSVIIISSHDQESSVAKRNYVVNASKTYTYDETLSLLRSKLISKSVLKADGETTTDGSKVTFVYHTKTTVNSVEMYITRMDVTKGGTTSTSGYYGVATKTGKCYKVNLSGGTYSVTEY